MELGKLRVLDKNRLNKRSKLKGAPSQNERLFSLDRHHTPGKGPARQLPFQITHKSHECPVIPPRLPAKTSESAANQDHKQNDQKFCQFWSSDVANEKNVQFPKIIHHFIKIVVKSSFEVDLRRGLFLRTVVFVNKQVSKEREIEPNLFLLLKSPVV